MPLDYPIHRRTLPNGLRVVVSPDHTVPNVTVNLWVGVGSRHEQPGRTGFAHLFEHLMFQGSRGVRSGEHFEALMAEGGRLNATTWFDRTNYFETVPTGALELALWLEADRHGHLLAALTQENLDNQRDVVKEEKRQRYDNQPYGNALVDVYAAVFPEGHPYHHPTIGSMADLDAAGVDDVHAFFRRHYAPDNTVLTLCGDIEPEAGFALVERHFGPLTARAEAPRPTLPQLEPLEAPVRVVRREQVPNDRVHVAFRLPVDGSDELVAAMVALDCLAGLSTSRLVRRLVRREQVAVGAHATAWGFVDGVSLGFVVLDVAPGADPDRLEDAMVEELERLAADGPTDAELEASIAQSERGWLSALASQEDRADMISRFALLHDDPQMVNTHLDRMRAVTPERVVEATRRWLAPHSRAVVAYLGDEAPAEAVA
ncbi:pitrilysin family protein [Nostocoides sp. Soil756]|uniref:M16 family metallopeptidase n=1 Tax=Nostocoides sp. Soil756 TaxID=1736399 RepID=UPI0006FEABA2|nr:pitrilysin family protein [Tetrasphaera sp. Soil756]KRE61233.1 peptidase M16 [Tetrasphaera sp. Soil756]